MSLNISKAGGCDGISPHFLKLCATSLLTPITNLLSLCMTKCTLPREWKVHKISPIFKGGDVHCANNYRPISLLCILSKVLESIVFQKVVDFVRPHISTSQHGFVQGKSCLSQLLHSYSEIFCSLDKGSPCDIIFFDIKKAFDIMFTRNYYINCGHLVLLDLCGCGSKTIFLIAFIMSASMGPHPPVCLCFQGCHKAVYSVPFFFSCMLMTYITISTSSLGFYLQMTPSL